MKSEGPVAFQLLVPIISESIIISGLLSDCLHKSINSSLPYLIFGCKWEKPNMQILIKISYFNNPEIIRRFSSWTSSSQTGLNQANWA